MLCIHTLYKLMLDSFNIQHRFFNAIVSPTIFYHRHKKNCTPNISDGSFFVAKNRSTGTRKLKNNLRHFFSKNLCDLFKPGTETKVCGRFLCEGFFFNGLFNISAKRKRWEQIFWSRWWFLKMMRFDGILSELRNRWLYSARTLKSLVFYSSFHWLPNPVLQLSNRKAKQRKTSHQRGPISKPHFSFLGFQVLSIYSMEKTNGWKPEKPLVEECHLFCLKISTFFGVRKSWVIPGMKSTEYHSCSLILKSLRSQLIKKNLFEDTEVVLLSETYAPQTLPSHWPALFFWMSPQVQWIQRWDINFFGRITLILSEFESLHIQLFFVLQTNHRFSNLITQIFFHDVTRNIFICDHGSSTEVFHEF